MRLHLKILERSSNGMECVWDSSRSCSKFQGEMLVFLLGLARKIIQPELPL